MTVSSPDLTPAESAACGPVVQVGDVQLVPATGELLRAGETLRLEPKVADLLVLLATHAGRAVSREQILQALWPGMVVGEDSLARAVSRLRQALGDDARAPRYVETLSKRGYRLIAQPVRFLDLPARAGEATAGAKVSPDQGSPSPLPRAQRRPRTALAGVVAAILVAIALVMALAWQGLGWWSPAGEPAAELDALTAQADDFYFQFSRGDNEAAIELYERVLSLDPRDANAMAGLANALVQRSVRWPDLPGEPPVQFTRLGDALAHGHLQRAPAALQLQRARRLAERAVELAPGSAAAHKAAGFAASAQGRFDAALESYARAVAIDPDAWGSLINIGDVLEITGRRDEALPYFERAYAAMERAYAVRPVQVRPWRAELGVLIADRLAAQSDLARAEAWYRRVLAHAPLHPAATHGLARLLHAGGDAAEARRLCEELLGRVGPAAACPPHDAPRGR